MFTGNVIDKILSYMKNELIIRPMVKKEFFISSPSKNYLKNFMKMDLDEIYYKKNIDLIEHFAIAMGKNDMDYFTFIFYMNVNGLSTEKSITCSILCFYLEHQSKLSSFQNIMNECEHYIDLVSKSDNMVYIPTLVLFDIKLKVRWNQIVITVPYTDRNIVLYDFKYVDKEPYKTVKCYEQKMYLNYDKHILLKILHSFLHTAFFFHHLLHYYKIHFYDENEDDESDNNEDDSEEEELEFTHTKGDY